MTTVVIVALVTLVVLLLILTFALMRAASLDYPMPDRLPPPPPFVLFERCGSCGVPNGAPHIAELHPRPDNVWFA